MFINVYTLTPEDLINEKVNAYLKRRKIRDLYDIFFLSKYADKNKVSLIRLIENFKTPEDEESLKSVVIVGAVPTSKNILDYITRWVK